MNLKNKLSLMMKTGWSIVGLLVHIINL